MKKVFPAVLYAKKWIQAGNARTDSGLGRKRVEEFDLGEIDEDLDEMECKYLDDSYLF